MSDMARRLWIWIAMSCAAGGVARGDELAAAAWHVDVATQPDYFFEQGYYAWVGIRPAPLPHWSFAAGAFAFDLPDFYMFGSNKGFHLRSNPSGGIDADRYFRADGRGWYLGLALAYFRRTYTRDGAPGESVQQNGWFTHLNVGYRWFPWRTAGFYIEPWGFLGTFITKSTSDVDVGGATYSALPVSFSVDVRLGWDFAL